MAVERSTMPKQDCWNVEAFFPNFSAWQDRFDIIFKKEKPHWPNLQTFKGELNKAANVRALLELCFSIERSLTALCTYAHLRHDEEITNDEAKTAYSKISALFHDFSDETSWIEPELLSLDQEILDAILEDPILADYQFHLEKLVRVKKHMLSAEMEALMAKAGKALQSPQKTFSAINDADFKFGEVLDGKGNLRELTHANYGLYIREHDRVLRKNAFTQMHQKYTDFENTLCELLNGQVQSHIFNSRTRSYKSSLEASLFPNNIDCQVYHALVEAVNSRLSELHKYIDLRKQILGVDALHLYDMSVPLTSDIEIHLPYEEAEDLIIESVSPLGAEYQNLLKKGFKEQGWVDRYENKNKRSGAYSSGSYDSMPYILMNYKGQLKDAFTLAHEAGHSMHSLLTHTHQSYQYGNYSIFLAEVASTFNEELLMQTLLKRAKNNDEKIYLINQKIEDIRGTLFRQTMFAEYELLIHTLAEQEIPLTPTLLRLEYHKLNQKYFGFNAVIDPEIDSEWARIPHFYYNFYVFQYATGISAALALNERVVKGGTQERNEYLAFLKGGSSRYPIEMLKLAGINMLEPAPVQSAIGRFSDSVDQLSKLLETKSESAKVFST
ncbi:MAG: oligoendopeptidase F [Parachlamydiaceae bacterium]|nr:oligoendopeptidase F [Parachlamydiaceae bacterium]